MSSVINTSANMSLQNQPFLGMFVQRPLPCQPQRQYFDSEVALLLLLLRLSNDDDSNNTTFRDYRLPSDPGTNMLTLGISTLK
jgi:hypothetical protein